MTGKLLNTIGLVLGMLGVMVIFIFGPPQPSFEAGVSLGLSDKNILEDGCTVAEHNKEIESLKKHYSKMSKIGLILVFIGFALQLWAVCL